MLGTRRPLVLPLAAATAMVGVRAAEAQLDLPPPPPPPLDETDDVPSLPPPPAPPAPSGSAEPLRHGPLPNRGPRRAPIEPRPEPAPPEDSVPEPAPPHPIAATWNAAGIPWGRLSANLELEVAPHHALVLSPNALLFHVDRGSGRDLLSEGFGFASAESLSFGAELGYHYWLRGLPSLSGPFFGPALVFGATTRADVGDPSHAQGYWGLAFDAGAQQVLFGGLTLGAGAGLEIARMAAVTAVLPRLLGQVGWSF